MKMYYNKMMDSLIPSMDSLIPSTFTETPPVRPSESSESSCLFFFSWSPFKRDPVISQKSHSCEIWGVEAGKKLFFNGWVHQFFLRKYITSIIYRNGWIFQPAFKKNVDCLDVNKKKTKKIRKLLTGHVSYMNHEILIDSWRCDGWNPGVMAGILTM